MTRCSGTLAGVSGFRLFLLATLAAQLGMFDVVVFGIISEDWADFFELEIFVLSVIAAIAFGLLAVTLRSLYRGLRESLDRFD